MRPIAISALLLALSGCGSSDDFTVSQDVTEQRVEGDALGGDLTDLWTIPMTLAVQDEIDVKNMGPFSATVSAFRLEAVTALERNCPGGTWSFLDHADFFVEAAGLPRLKFASANGPGNVKIYRPTLTSPAVNMAPYIMAGGTITAEGTGNKPQSDFCYSGVATFAVHPQ